MPNLTPLPIAQFADNTQARDDAHRWTTRVPENLNQPEVGWRDVYALDYRETLCQ